MNDKTLKKIAASIGALIVIYNFSTSLYKRIVSIDEGIKTLNRTVEIVEEHKKYISEEINTLIDKCLEEIRIDKPLDSYTITRLSVYKEILPKTMTSYQIRRIDYILDSYEKNSKGLR